MNTNKKIKKLNIKVKVKQRPNFTNANSETENSSPQIPTKVTGFERTVFGDTIWFNSIYGTTVRDAETKGCNDDQMFKVANYYTNEDLAKWCNRSDNLTRKMRRWAAEHNEQEIKWEDREQPKFFIYYGCAIQECRITCVHQMISGDIFFSTKEIAEAAIAEFGDEIKWLAENRPEWF